VADATPHGATAALGRLVLDFRLLALLGSLLYFPLTPGREGAAVQVAMLLALLASFVPLIQWDRLAPLLIRHPLWFALDCALSVAILVVTGTDGPFLTYTLGSAFLAGVLYGWAGASVFSVVLVAGYVVAAVTGGAPPTFQVLVATPFLYLGLAAGAAAVRAVLIRQAVVEAELATAQRERAAAGERMRLARELHDKLGKTIHGIGLHASALALRIEADPGGSPQAALALARAAEHAAGEARELIGDLRADQLDAPLETTIRQFVGAWSEGSGIEARLRAAQVAGLDPATRYELFAVLKEALRNVERHAQASCVEVELEMVGDEVRLAVRDDGVGLPEPADPEGLAARGHFGIVGMRERMQGAGGTLQVGRREPRGTVVTATVSAPADTPPRRRSLQAASR